MASCTLDDLVPSIKCNRIFLEPLGSSYSEYDVKIEASVYDDIQDDAGIADYLLSDTFKQNIAVVFVFSRSNVVKDYHEFLKSSGASPAFQSFIFVETFVRMGNFMSHMSEEEVGLYNGIDFYRDLTSSSDTIPISSVVRSLQFKNTLVQMYDSIKASDYDFKLIDFQIYTNELIENHGARTLDEDGNIIYDLMIPREDLTFSNSTDVENCYLHAASFFNTDRLVDGIQIPVTSDTISFFYKDVHDCHILESKRAASPLVQDFRANERIAEIIRTDRLTGYDQIIDEVSLASGESKKKSSLTSDLYTSYLKGESGMSPYVYGTFFVNLYQLVKRNSPYPFLYTNLEKSSPFNDSFESNITSMRIYRIRKDTKDAKHLVTNVHSMPGKLANETQGFHFSDLDFGRLTHGNYTYEIEMEIIDPIQDFMEDCVYHSKLLALRFKSSIEYIHNNPTSYNEIRDEINSQGKSDISNIISYDSQETKKELRKFARLFFALTGIDPMRLVPLLSAAQSTERRLIENMHRIIEDVIHAASKYFEVESINSSSSNSSQSPREIISYSRIWKIDVSPEYLTKGLINVFGSKTQLSENFYKQRMVQEITGHDQQVYDAYANNPLNFGCMTPQGIDDLNTYNLDGTLNLEAYFKLFSNIIDKKGSGQEEFDFIVSLFQTENQPYTSTIADIKNNSAMFESFLHDLGGTVENSTMSSLSTNVSSDISSEASFSFGIDNGENSFGSKTSNFGSFDKVSDEDKQSLEDKRDEIKGTMIAEKTKKEVLIMNMLLDREGYGILDRTDFAQGDKKRKRFNFNFNFAQKTAGKPYPAALRNTSKYFSLSRNGEGDRTKMPLARFILDNNYMVFYLSGFDENMNPQWKHLVDFQNLRNTVSSEEYGLNRVLCKLKRFQNSEIHIGQGSTSDREIMCKHFYLYLN